MPIVFSIALVLAAVYYAALIGFFVFAEVPDIWTWTGAAIIIGSAVYIARREARRAPPAQENKV